MDNKKDVPSVKKTEKRKAGKFKGIVLQKFKARGLTYNPGEEYFTENEGSFNHLINSKKIKK